MALSASTVFEVRTTGNDTNGGGYVTGSSGTDWSLQDSPQYSVTDGVTAGTTTITSATASFGTDVVGNIMYVSGGTGSVTAGWYQITARTNSTTVTVDRSTGLTAGTGVTLKIGGALATPTTAVSLMTVTGIVTWVKSGTYTVGTGITFPAHGTGYSAVNFVQGYTTTRGDRSTRPTIRATAAITIFTMGVEGLSLINLDIDGNSVSTVTGVSISGRYNSVVDCVIRRTTVNGVTFGGGNSVMIRSEVTGCTGTTAVLNSNASAISIRNCNVHDNTVPGINCGTNPAGIQVNGCLVYNNTGASSDGIVGAYEFGVNNCTIYGNGRDGVRLTGGFPSIGYAITDNILVSNGGYGINFSTAPVNAPQAYATIAYNAFYGNTSGSRNNVSTGTGDVTLTGDPFTNAGSGDFSLNNTSGAGAACRAAGFPGVFPGGTTTGYLDMGSVQHQDTGGGGGVVNVAYW